MVTVAFHKISVRNAELDEPAGLVSGLWPPPPSPTLRVNPSEAREKTLCSDQSPLHLESGLRGRSRPSPACAGSGQRSGGEHKRETLLPGSPVGLGLLPPRSPGGHGSSWGGWSGGTSSKEAESWQAAGRYTHCPWTSFQSSIHFPIKISLRKQMHI